MTSPASRHLAGIGMMLLGIFLFSLNDAMGKWLVATYSVGQVLLFRSLAALIALIPVIFRQGPERLIRVPRPSLQIARVVFTTAEVGIFYWVLTYLPLADTITLMLVGPIMVVVISAVALREQTTLRHWLAVVIGFAGVAMAMQPSMAIVSRALPAFGALAGALFFALLTITARQLRTTPDVTLVFWQNAGALALGAVLMAADAGPWPSAIDLAALAMLGIVAMLAHLCVTRSLKLAPASLVAPYQYALIVWAVLLGWLIFGDMPAPMTILGATLIAGSGLALLAMEARRG